MCDTWRNRMRFGVMVLCAACAAASSVARADEAGAKPGLVATAPGVYELTYAVPGSSPDATSKALIYVPPDANASTIRTGNGPAEEASQDTSGATVFPAVYLLHGYSADYKAWDVITRDTDRPLLKMAERFGVIIVCPDGKFASWYLNAPAVGENAADWQWETAMIDRLIPQIDKRFPTIAKRGARAICGLSMGGHGAMYLAAKHPDLFVAAGTMSGVMDLTETTRKYELSQRLGTYEEHPENWRDHSVVHLADKFVENKQALLIDCGIEDPFINNNRALHEKLLKLKVPHDYVERPGGHTRPYWANALPYHLQFLTDHMETGDVELVSMTGAPAKDGVHAYAVRDIDGGNMALSKYNGKVVLMVNVASKCGYTKQYTGLQALYEKYKDKGLVVLGVPSNDFGGQEPGSETEIKTFCSTKYNVSFPMTSKMPVKNGDTQNPLYRYLSEKAANGVLDAKVAWNFNKFLIGKDGKVIAHYESKVAPEDPGLAKAIETALGM